LVAETFNAFLCAHSCMLSLHAGPSCGVWGVKGDEKRRAFEFFYGAFDRASMWLGADHRALVRRRFFPTLQCQHLRGRLLRR
ncbi:MAG: hypothetical protein K1X64_21500, partial [Myxococcaceae bacterium]|nr:hypothetical protein [Myxococcaceae bacterium]